MCAQIATKNDIYKYEIGIIPCFCIHKTGIITCNVLGDLMN